MAARSVEVLDVAMLSTLSAFEALRTDGMHVGNETQTYYQSLAFSIMVQYFTLLST